MILEFRAFSILKVLFFVPERNLQGSHNRQNYQGCREGPEEKITMGHPKHRSATGNHRPRAARGRGRWLRRAHYCPLPVVAVES